MRNMTVVAEDFIRVGRVKIPLATAEAWVQDYTNEEKSRASSAPYAYPAYDRYAEATNDPLLLTDGDLLAPVLLNVRLSIRSFYALQRSREELQEGLANEDLALPLAEIDDPERITAMVKPLYSVLDDPASKPWGVEGTTLSRCCTASGRSPSYFTTFGSAPATSVRTVQSCAPKIAPGRTT